VGELQERIRKLGEGQAYKTDEPKKKLIDFKAYFDLV
jgi:hypothetical protein